MKPTPRRVFGRVTVVAGWLCALLATGPLGDAAAQSRSTQPRPEASQTKPEGEMRWRST